MLPLAVDRRGAVIVPGQVALVLEPRTQAEHDYFGAGRRALIGQRLIVRVVVDWSGPCSVAFENERWYILASCIQVEAFTLRKLINQYAQEAS